MKVVMVVVLRIDLSNRELFMVVEASLAGTLDSPATLN